MSTDRIENIKYVVTHLITQFFVIFGCIVIFMTFMRSSRGLEPTSYQYMFYIMEFSALGALPSLILLLGANVSAKWVRILTALHFVVLETLIIGAAFGLKITKEPADAVVLFIEVAVIYVIVQLLDWGSDKKTSDKINEGLRKRKGMSD